MSVLKYKDPTTGEFKITRTVKVIGDDGGSESAPAFVICADGLLRNVHERTCGALPVRDGGYFLCKKNAPCHVALGFCPDGAASWHAPSGDDGKVEAVG